MSNNLINEIGNFVNQYKGNLPVNTSEIIAAHERAESLMTRFESESMGSIPEEVTELSDLHGQLGELRYRATRHDQKEQASRRALTQRESFAVASMERALRDYRSRLATNPAPHIQEMLQSCISVTERKLKDLIEGRISARDAMIRKQELSRELIQLKSRLALTKNADAAVEIVERISQIDAELQRGN